MEKQLGPRWTTRGVGRTSHATSAEGARGLGWPISSGRGGSMIGWMLVQAGERARVEFIKQSAALKIRKSAIRFLG